MTDVTVTNSTQTVLVDAAGSVTQVAVNSPVNQVNVSTLGIQGPQGASLVIQSLPALP